MVLREYDEAAHINNEKKLSEERILLIAIQDYLEDKLPKETIIQKLVTRYQLSPERAEECFIKATTPKHKCF